MRVRFTPEAAANVAAIGRFLKERNPSSAKRVRADIRASVKRIGEQPRSGRMQIEQSVRGVVTKQYGYLVYYKLLHDGAQVDILAVLHPAQQRLYSDN